MTDEATTALDPTSGSDGSTIAVDDDSSSGTDEPPSPFCNVPSEDYPTIQTALDAAWCATISVADGDYYENLIIDRDVELVGGDVLTNRPRLLGAVDQRVVRVFFATVTIRGINIIGNEDHTSGCVSNMLGELTIADAYLIECRLVGGEGAAVRSRGALTLVNVGTAWNYLEADAADGSAQVLQGGDVYIEAAELVMQGSRLWYGATSLSGSGGEIRGGQLAAVDAYVTIEDSEISAGHVYASDGEALIRGGAIYVERGSLRIERSSIPGGDVFASTAVLGAGIHAVDSDVAIAASNVNGGASSLGTIEGGGVRIESTIATRIEIDGSSLSGEIWANDDVAGAGLSVGTNDGAVVELSVVNSRFDRPRVLTTEGEARGAALHAASADGSVIDVVIANATSIDANIFGNEPGGALSAVADASSDVTITVQNSILWGTVGPDCLLENATLVSNGHNMFSAVDSCDSAVAGDLLGVDPMLVTDDVALQPGSPAIDGGDPAGCTDGEGNPLLIDVFGNPRPVGIACDIGAVEDQG